MNTKFDEAVLQIIYGKQPIEYIEQASKDWLGKRRRTNHEGNQRSSQEITEYSQARLGQAATSLAACPTLGAYVASD